MDDWPISFRPLTGEGVRRLPLPLPKKNLRTRANPYPLRSRQFPIARAIPLRSNPVGHIVEHGRVEHGGALDCCVLPAADYFGTP